MSPTVPDNASIRQFLKRRFNDEELTNLSFDYFNDVYQDFSTGMSRSIKIQLLLDYCQRRDKMLDLLATLERERPAQYRSELAAKSRVAPPEPPTYRERNPRQVFISHAREDREFAHRLAEDLQQRDWAVWIAPDSIRPGEKWVEAINRGLTESGIVALVLTPEAAESAWVKSETSAAIELEHRREAQFIPLELRPASVPPLWRAYQRLSFRRDYNAGLREFLAELDRMVGLPDQPAAPAPPARADKRPAPEVHPSIALRLSAKPDTVEIGDDVRWTVSLRNDGDVDLIVVIPRRGQVLLDEPFELAQGKGRRFTFESSHDEPGQWTETITATGITGDGSSILEQISESVTVRRPAPKDTKAPVAPRPARQKARQPQQSRRAEKAGIFVDEGAIRALERGASLLPVGVLRIEGTFSQGATIDLLTPQGKKFAEGVSSYSSAEIQRIKGKQSSEIGRILGEHRGDAVVPHGKISPLGTRSLAGTTPQKETYLFKGVVVDDGAIRAIKGGASLLPVGVLQVTGDFPAGASIALLTRLGGKFGEGVTNYSAAEIDRIKGRQSAEISQLIDEYRGDEVVSHRKITLIGSRLFLGQQLGSVGRGEAAGVVVGEGAIQAIKRGASLLPVGVLETVGTFRRGEAIAIMNRNGKRVATGVTSYSSDAVERIKGRHSSEIKPTLGLLRYNGDSVIPHRKLTLE